MQKLLPTLSRAAKPAFVAAGVAGSGSTSHCRAAAPVKPKEPGSPTAKGAEVSVEEAPDGWGFLTFQTPVKQEEVASALSELAVLGGVSRRRAASPPPPLAPAAPAAGPVIEEVGDDGSSVTSEGTEADLMLRRADTLDAVFGGPGAFEADEETCDPMDNLSMVISNLLLNPRIANTIQQELVKDPHFYALMAQVNPGLPSIARPLLITDITAEEDGEARGGDGIPLGALLQGLQRGVVAAAVKLGEAFAHVGNMLRRLGDNLRMALEGASRAEGRAAAGSAEARAEAARRFEMAVVKVACAVAVVVFVRRGARIFA